MKLASKIHSPTVHVVMYAMLLFATPFLMLRNYMQEAIGSLSRFSFSLFGLEVAYVLAFAIILLSATIIVLRRHITLYRVLASVAVVLMFALAQNSTDYYFNHKFWDIQHNWHYFAYGIFAFMMFRALEPKRLPPAKIIFWTFITAVFISSCDEILQKFISNRVFDMCDIAKDTWGVLIGMVIIQFVVKSGKIVQNGWRIRQPKLADYLNTPFPLLFLQIVFAYIFLFFSSILSDSEYWLTVIAITLGLFVLFFAILHLSQRRPFKIAFAAIAVILVLVQSFFFIKYRKENIVYNSFGITVYKGIPIPYFDILIHPNGTFRLADKKHVFNMRDMQFFEQRTEYILLIGSGSEGKGGKGFPEQWESQFIYNPFKERGLQIIIQKTPEACKTFNRLKNEGKNVLFVIHNTC